MLGNLFSRLLSCIMILYACQNLSHDQLRYQVIFHNYCLSVSFHFNLFNRDLNRGFLVYMFSLRFAGSKFLINLQRQFRVRFFVFVKFFPHKILRDIQSFHFVLKITISKMHYVVCCSFIKTCSLTGC